MKVGDIVQQSESYSSKRFGNMRGGENYVVIGKAVAGGWFIQSVEDGSMPVAGYENIRVVDGKKVESWQGREVVASVGFMPSQVKVVGRYSDYKFEQQQFAFAA